MEQVCTQAFNRPIHHAYSAGKLYWDGRRHIYALDGTNFENAGQKYCHWETVASYLDIGGRKFYYVFTAQLEGALDKVYYGFGVVNLGENAKRELVPIDGHYTSASIDSQSMSHSMCKLDNATYQRNRDGSSLIALIERFREPRQSVVRDVYPERAVH